MGGPLVSIVTPTLNPGLRLERCLASVETQTYPHIEHLVIDGGSTDGTLKVLRSRGVRWISEPDDGQASAINKGWRLAGGEILGWLNADDELVPDAVESIVRAFASGNIDWVVGAVEIREGRRGFIRRPADPNRPITWAAQNLAAQPGSFLSRHALEQVGYLDENLHFMMDMDLWVRMLDRGLRAARIPLLLAIFEVHGDSKSGSLSHSEFVIEEALVRLRSGRLRSGAVAVGRAAATRAWERKSLSVSSMKDEADRILADRRFMALKVDSDLVEAGGRAERLLLLLKSRQPEAVVSAFDIEIWRHAEARARVFASFTRGLARLRYVLLHR